MNISRQTMIHLSGVLLFTGITAVYAAQGPAPKETDTATIVGMVVSIEENEEGVITTIAIEVPGSGEYAYDADYYYVAKDRKGKELFKCIQKKVSVTGGVIQDEDGVKTIFVKSYLILKSDVKPVTKYDDLGEDL